MTLLYSFVQKPECHAQNTEVLMSFPCDIITLGTALLVFPMTLPVLLEAHCMISCLLEVHWELLARQVYCSGSCTCLL